MPSLPGLIDVRVAVVASLAVHAGLIAWMCLRDPGPRSLTPAATRIETLVTVVIRDVVTPEPASPKLAAPHASEAGVPHHARNFNLGAAAGAGASEAGLSHHARNFNLVTAAGATGDVEKVGPAEPMQAASTAVSGVAPARGGSLAMRRVDLSPAQIVDIAPRDVVPGAGARDGELRPSGHGTYTTDLGGSDWRVRTATAQVARDGTVRFDNAPDFDIHFAGLGVMGKFNVDDWLARKAGIDPYASAKLAYLDRTRDERVHIAQANRTADLAHPAIAMRRNLDAVRAIADPTARKQALFELWDDVAEDGDVELVRAGADARAYLVGAIRSMRPALAFTPDELAQLNTRRHSRAVFAPYD